MSIDKSYAEHFNQVALETQQKLRAFPRFVPRPAQANYLFKWELFKQVLEVQGSVVELGVLLGSGLFAFANFSTILEPYNYQRKIIGFDTFEGFPSLTDVDNRTGQHTAQRKVGGFWVSESHFDEIKESVKVYDDNRYLNQKQKIELVRGDVTKTVPEYVENNPHLLISLLYLDLDLYEPTLAALEALYSRVVPGGIVAFDEVNDPRWPGETTAVQEFFHDLPGRLIRMPFEPAACYFVKE